MIYADRRGMIRKLIEDNNYEMIVEIYDDERQLTAGLFIRRR